MQPWLSWQRRNHCLEQLCCCSLAEPHSALLGEMLLPRDDCMILSPLGLKIY